MCQWNRIRETKTICLLNHYHFSVDNVDNLVWVLHLTTVKGVICWFAWRRLCYGVANACGCFTFLYEEELLPLLCCLVGRECALRHFQRAVPLVDVVQCLRPTSRGSSGTTDNLCYWCAISERFHTDICHTIANGYFSQSCAYYECFKYWESTIYVLNDRKVFYWNY